ncbi:hypothetical protein [Streptomyces sp. C8S0]|uniref:hypothetical protein n=1 Tax=Streptomyces sp. C8S0 TaxID=2585716 RepID=UPI001D04628E|nr:hypothetical protein [Streptomyces sp. C8S0]
MRQTKSLPIAVQRWAEQFTGPVVTVRDASHDWHRSRVWELTGESGARWYVKVAPSGKFFARETRAYRGVVPALGHSRAPVSSPAARTTWRCCSWCPVARHLGWD